MPTTIAISPTGTIGITGQLAVDAQAVENVTLDPASSQVPVPLPVGLSPAKFAIIFATDATDLTFQLGIAAGATVIQVPNGEFAIVYDVSTLYLNSVLGGGAQVIFG